MKGLTNIDQLLAQLQPVLLPGEYVFCTTGGAKYGDLASLCPIATIREDEGLTMVLDHRQAIAAGIEFDSVYRELVLQVHSSLAAVGLTAAVSTALAEQGISANILAGSYHDHIFVPANRADEALAVLQALSGPASGF